MCSQTGEGDGLWEFDQGHVVSQQSRSPIRVNGVDVGTVLDSVGFLGGCEANVVSTQHDVKERGIVGAVCSIHLINPGVIDLSCVGFKLIVGKLTSGSQNPIGRDERTTAKVLVIDEQSHLPVLKSKLNSLL
jgi:hypothetical protein